MKTQKTDPAQTVDLPRLVRRDVRPEEIIEIFVRDTELTNRELRPLIEELVKLQPEKVALLEHMASLEKSIADAKSSMHLRNSERPKAPNAKAQQRATNDEPSTEGTPLPRKNSIK